MSETKRLGKGLSALLADAGAETQSEQNSEQLIEIPLNGLDPNPYQPRQTFDDEMLEELANSIAVHGVIQPIIVSQNLNGRYTLIAGERRWRAARRAGLVTIPAVLRDLSDRELMEVSLIENLQRENLSAIEEAEAIKRILDEFTVTQDQLAKRIGKSRSAVANALRLLTLSAPLIDMIRSGLLTAGHARAIMTVSAEEQERFAREIVANGWTVREAEKLAATWEHTPRKYKIREQTRDIFISSAERDLTQTLGTKVSIAGSQKKGKIVLEYYSPQDLQRLYERLGGMLPANASEHEWPIREEQQPE